MLFSCGTSSNGDGELPAASFNTSISGSSLTIAISVPDHHHAYLDRGEEGNLIPVQFYWEDFVEAGILETEPEPISAPEGVFDEDERAIVLRGEGEYVFEIGNAGELSGETLRARTQICDEIRGVCYRPENHDIQL